MINGLKNFMNDDYAKDNSDKYDSEALLMTNKTRQKIFSTAYSKIVNRITFKNILEYSRVILGHFSYNIILF